MRAQSAPLPWYQRARGAAAISLTLALVACGGDGADSHPPATFNDPLYSQQWHLHNFGQRAFSSHRGVPGVDLNVTSLHAAGILGQGVPVMVVDSGIQSTHEDLAANVDHSMLYSFDPASPDPNDVMPPGDPDEYDNHGTAVAGIIGAVHDNRQGEVGVAREATLGGIRLLCDGCYSVENNLASFGNAPFSENTWVFNGSYGYDPYGPIPADYDDDAKLVAMHGLTRLRDGKGAIFLKAAGNSFRAVGWVDDPRDF